MFLLMFLYHPLAFILPVEPHLNMIIHFGVFEILPSKASVDQLRGPLEKQLQQFQDCGNRRRFNPKYTESGETLMELVQ